MYFMHEIAVNMFSKAIERERERKRDLFQTAAAVAIKNTHTHSKKKKKNRKVAKWKSGKCGKCRNKVKDAGKDVERDSHFELLCHCDCLL